MGDGPGKVKPRKRRGHRGHSVLRDRIEYAALRTAVLLLRALPVEVASSLMGRAWRVYGPRSEKHRRALENLSIALPHLTDEERERIALDQWENLGRVSAESFLMDTFVREQDRSRLTIDSVVEEKLRAPGGIVFASMHSANWEVGAMPLQRYRTLAGLYQEIKNPLVDAYVAELRKRVFTGGVFAKGIKTPGHVMRWIREGNAICMLADHREGRGIDVTVFGRRTKANPFPAMVARRLGVPLIAGRALRMPGSRFTVELVEIPVPVSDDAPADVAAATQSLQEQFETWIRDRPGEWMWVQDRWRETRRSLASAASPEIGACQPQSDAPVSDR
jgi:Kdo2-lipid IVA lauroyltransferase/acyltransferase